MTRKKPFNPFYPILVVAGAAFGLTALGYFVMAAMATYDPVGAREAMDQQGGLLAIMDRAGVQIMVAELVVLAAATVLAISTDRFWTNLFEARHDPDDPDPSTATTTPLREANSEQMR